MPNGQRDNAERADAAAAALEAYTATNSGRYHEEPLEDRVGDLLCDLLHLVRRDGDEAQEPAPPGREYPTHLLDRARCNFEEEEADENGGEEETEDDEPAHEQRDPTLGETRKTYGPDKR